MLDNRNFDVIVLFLRNANLSSENWSFLLIGTWLLSYLLTKAPQYILDILDGE